MQYFVISLNKEIMNLKYSVGLDIASKKIDICMSVIDSNQRVIVVSSKSFLNTLNGFKDMDEWVVKTTKRKKFRWFYVWRPLEFIMKTVLYIFRKKI
jgi:hypothetical protein